MDTMIERLFIHTYDVRFLEDDIVDGDFPRDDVREDTIEVEADVPGMIALAFAAADALSREGCTYSEGCDWFHDPDGSEIVDYGTGERSERSAHLYLDAACTVQAPAWVFGLVKAATDHLPGYRAPYSPHASRLFATYVGPREWEISRDADAGILVNA